MDNNRIEVIKINKIIKNKKNIIIILSVCFILIVLGVVNEHNDTKHSYDHVSNNHYSKNYNYDNNYTHKKKALTEEEAQFLPGNGYGNTRPYSTAENMGIHGAKVKCEKCGYHSGHGYNNLCHHCLR